MTDELKLRKDLESAARAQRLLEDDTFKSAFEKLEADYIAVWRQTPARDTDARERLWQAVNILGKVRDHLGSVVANGAVAKRELDDLAHAGRRKIFGVV